MRCVSRSSWLAMTRPRPWARRSPRRRRTSARRTPRWRPRSTRSARGHELPQRTEGDAMSVSFVLEALVVVGSIVMGTRAGGVGVGLWGGLGTFVLVFIFGEAPGEPPAAAVAIILAVVTTAALMQAAG